MSGANSEISNKNETNFSDFFKETQKKYLEEKKLKYGFDFSNDISPAYIIDYKEKEPNSNFKGLE